MKSYTTFLLLILLTEIVTHNTQKNNTNHSQELKTFIVKTKLSKEELQELLSQSQTAFIYLRSKVHKNKNETKDENETVEEPGESLEKQIEEEIEKEALNPLEEFHIREMNNTKNNNNKAFIQKEESKVIVDSFYEKKYGKTYAYFTLFIVVFLIIYFRGYLFKGKENEKKNRYKNLFESDTNPNEYMLIKSE